SSLGTATTHPASQSTDLSFRGLKQPTLSSLTSPSRTTTSPTRSASRSERRSPYASSGQPTRIASSSKKSAFFITSGMTTSTGNSSSWTYYAGRSLTHRGRAQSEIAKHPFTSSTLLEPTISEAYPQQRKKNLADEVSQFQSPRNRPSGGFRTG